MTILISGLTASLISFWANRLLAGHFGESGFIGESPAVEMGAFVIPVMEEGLKGTCAYVFGVVDYIPMVYTVFGVVEGFYDAFTSRNKGALAAVAAILTHAAFGVITLVVYEKTRSLPSGIGAAATVHVTWNSVTLAIVGLSERGRRRDGRD